MAAAVETGATFEEMVEDLIRLEHDAIAAYEAAIDRLHSGELRSKLGEFTEDHRHHLSSLGELLTDAGKAPPRSGDAKRFLTRGKVVLGGLIGDAAVLRAMRSNEDETNAAYDRSLDFAETPEHARAALERARADERRHRDWLVAKLEDM